jgi:hypothetical protein
MTKKSTRERLKISMPYSVRGDNLEELPLTSHPELRTIAKTWMPVGMGVTQTTGALVGEAV